MPRWGRCDFSQFREFAKGFEKLSDSEIDDLCVACSKELAARLLALVIPATPVGKYPKGSGKKGGTLRRGWGAKNGKAGREYAQSLTVTKSGNIYGRNHKSGRVRLVCRVRSPYRKRRLGRGPVHADYLRGKAETNRPVCA